MPGGAAFARLDPIMAHGNFITRHLPNFIQGPGDNNIKIETQNGARATRFNSKMTEFVKKMVEVEVFDD